MQAPFGADSRACFDRAARRPSRATSSTQDCYIALELSHPKWLISALLPGRSKITTTLVPGGDTAALLDVLTRLAARAALDTGGPAAFKVCYAAGYDGFWLARFLIGHGIETHVLDPASFLVSRNSVAMARRLPWSLMLLSKRGGFAPRTTAVVIVRAEVEE